MNENTNLILSTEHIILAIVGLLLGVIITYLILRARSVSLKKHEQVKEELITIKHQLDTKVRSEKELKASLIDIKKELVLEKELNKTQETQITSFRMSIQNLQERINEEKITNQLQQKSIEQSQKDTLHLKTELSKIETIKLALEEKIQSQSLEFEESRKKSLVEFENIANRLFNEKTEKFNRQSKENLETILAPLKENLSDFRKKVEETYDKESKERFSLEGKIQELVKLNHQISEDATNLTNALKGQAKTQGNWGEMILETILEHSGLIKNQQYFIQESFKDEQGKRKQPDITIKYPDNRYIIIDSKVSLVAYERYANTDNKDEQELNLKLHIKSIKNHIDQLSSKEYEELDKALDFVFLFIPIEPAFLCALKEDTDLWNYAYNKRIVLMSPTNLIATLRIIVDVWKKENQNKNARDISKRGEKLYAKFVNFIRDMEDIDKHLKKANESYSNAFKKLSSGKGNLITQAEQLKKLGINPKQNISERLIENNNDYPSE